MVSLSIPQKMQRLKSMTTVRSEQLDLYLKVKGKGLDTCYRATYMSQTRDQQRFTISEVAADLLSHSIGSTAI